MPKRTARPLKHVGKKRSGRTSPLTRRFVERKHTRRVKQWQLRWQRATRQVQRTVSIWTQLIRRWFVVGVGALVAIALGVFFFSPVVQVRTIHVQRTDARLDINKVKRALAPMFGRHLTFITSGEAEELIQRAIPDTQSVAVSKQYPSRITVRVTQLPLVARLAIERPNVPTGSGAVQSSVPAFEYLTENGLYVATSVAYSGATLPKITVKDLGAEPVSGSRLVTPDFMERMKMAEQILTEEFGTKILYRTIYVRAREFHLAERHSLWFDMASSLDDQFLRYRTFLQSPMAKEVSRYVDLRVPGAIVFR